MGVYGGPEAVNDSLILQLDAVNIKSFRGENTTNLAVNSSDMSGTTYSPNGEWVSSQPTRLNKVFDPNIRTPLGYGATRISESGVGGYHHLSRYGGGGTGNFSLSCYIKPISPDVSNFSIGMLAGDVTTFNLVNRTISTRPNMNDPFLVSVPGYPDWFRVGVNVFGRAGGWVGCLGLSAGLSYAGVSGSKACYITGVQYELKSYPRTFVSANTTRGTSFGSGGGALDISGNNFHGELINGVAEEKYNESVKSFVLDGTNDYIEVGHNSNLNAYPITISAWIYVNTTSGGIDVINKYVSGSVNGYRMGLNSSLGLGIYYFYGSISNGLTNYDSYSGTVSLQKWTMVTATVDSSGGKLYVNDSLVGSRSWSGVGGTPTTTQPLRLGNYNTQYFNGKIADCRIYNRALSSSEIQQNFAATRGRFGI